MDSILKKICDLLESPDREMKQAAARVLSELGVRNSQAIKMIGGVLLKEKDAALKSFILDIPLHAPSKEFLPYLISCLSDISISREKAIQAISHFGSEAIPILVKRYTEAGGGEKRSILSVLAKLGERNALDFVLQTLVAERQNVEHLKFVCYLLKEPIGRLKKKDRVWFKHQLVELFRKTKKDDSLTVACLVLFGFLQDVSSRGLLLKVLCSSTSVAVRKHALVALAQLKSGLAGSDELARKVIPLLSDSDYPNIVKNVIQVLDGIAISKKMQSEILKLLESPHPSVRSFALSKLGSFESKGNISTLIGYLNSADFRIREAARHSLEKMPKAVGHLLTLFESVKEMGKADLIASILKCHKNVFKVALCKKLFQKMERFLKLGDERFRHYLSLIRNVNPNFLYHTIFAKYKVLKRRRKWNDALNCIGFLEGGFLFDAEVRYELAICKLMTSKRDFSIISRDQDAGLLALQGFVKSNGPELYKKLLKDRSLTHFDLYYIGFHFSEKLFELKRFGVGVLQFLMKRSKSGKVKRLAERKLASVETAGVASGITGG